ncbi:MAG TPA: conjugal transfer protein TrbD [Ferrovaceae bacterium]|nr:conjugal transfer protein TrbD [Acidocella sp.]HQT82019.1 conjugal transfer protein TrbD [Ferrovaceae bacterium]HQU07143.1 conjugal transfer protein TrbD [Ferrovaceae bacterium]
MSNDYSTPIHDSLNRPILLMGGERNLVLMLAVIAGVFIFSLAHVWAAVMGVTMWMIGQWALSRAATYDPQLSQTGIRSMKYKRYYPAQATPFAPQREMK